MTIAQIPSAFELITDYIQGRWDRIHAVYQRQLVATGECCQIKLVDVLHAVLPAVVIDSGLDDATLQRLNPRRRLKLVSCQSDLIRAMSFLSSSNTFCFSRSVSVFLSSLSDLIIDLWPEFSGLVSFLDFSGSSLLQSSLHSTHLGNSFRLAQVLPRRMTVVLGMHRSGTSALTGMLHHAGLTAPRDVLGASPGNPLGYWESRSLVALTDQFLAHIDCTWSKLFLLPSRWHDREQTSGWVADYLKCMVNCFDGADHIVLKDPRLCLLFSALLPSFTSAGLTSDYLLILRSPIEVITSLTAIHPVSAQDALCLWIASVLQSERITRYVPRQIFTFEHLLHAPDAVLTSCRAMWQSDLDLSSDQLAMNFIDPSLHRNKVPHLRACMLEHSPHLEPLLTFAEGIYSILALPDEVNVHVRLDKMHAEWMRKLVDLDNS